MIQRLLGPLPLWARREHPMLRQELRVGERALSWRARYGRALGVILIGAVLLLIGYLIATRLLSQAAGENIVEIVTAVLYYPLLMIQLLLRIAAFTLTVGVITEQKRLGNWDNLRATEHGAELALRARWVSVFYRLRGLFGVVIGLRGILIVLVLYELTFFQGRHLDLFIVGITPEISLVVAVLLLSFLLTGSLLLPLTGAGFDASLGVLVSTLVPQRTYSTLVQGLIILARIALTALLVYAAGSYLNNETPLTDAGAWLLLFALGAIGDWGLAFLFLGRFGEIWALVPYGVFLGLALLIFALMQAMAADVMLTFAARRAQKHG
jgi:hypothetical protein